MYTYYSLYLKMASTGIGFRWLDILEKEFDTNFVDLDISLGEIEAEEPDIICNARHKMSALSSCFAQLTHKAQTIFQNSAKIEAELVNLRVELIEAKAKRESLEQELRTTVLELHNAQLANKLPGNHNSNDKSNISGSSGATLEPQEVDRIRKRLQEELDKSPDIIKDSDDPKKGLHHIAQLRAENAQLQNENIALRNSILALHSEVYGARLAAKYLDKELAGRIQQLQLLGREMRGDIRDKLWRQLEAEILLQRHKTVVRACRRNTHITSNGNLIEKHNQITTLAPTPDRGLGDTRLVTVKRNHGVGLGISITGGREHGVPILISELEPNGPAALSNQLYIGDAILSVNGIDLKQACHREAVKVLQQQIGDCLLMVQYIASEDSDTNSLSEDGYNFQYRFFDNVVCDSADPISLHPLQHGGAMTNTPTAPRTPEFNEPSSRNNSDDNLSVPPSPKVVSLSPVHKDVEELAHVDEEKVEEVVEINENLDLSSPRIDDKNVYFDTEVVLTQLNNNYNESLAKLMSNDSKDGDSIDSCADATTNCDNQKTDNVDNRNSTQNIILDVENLPDNLAATNANESNLDSANANAAAQVFFENNRTIISIEEAKIADKNCNIETELNGSTNSLLYTTESDNASSPIPTSIDNVISSDLISNNSESPQNFLNAPEATSQQTKTAFVVKNFKTEVYEPKVYNNSNLIEFTENLEKSLGFLGENFQSSLLDATNKLSSFNITNDFLTGCDNDSTTSDYVTDTVLGIYENISGKLALNEKCSQTSNDNSDSDKTHITSLLEMQKFKEFCKSDDAKNYSSNSESFSNNSPKSSLNASCPNESYDSSPIHRQCGETNPRKNPRKFKNRKIHGVKTIQSIFRNDDYLSSDISSINSDFNDDESKLSHAAPTMFLAKPIKKHLPKLSKPLPTKSSSDEKSSPETERLLEQQLDKTLQTFLTETFAKTEVQLPNLKIINSVQKTREKPRLKPHSPMNDLNDGYRKNQESKFLLADLEKAYEESSNGGSQSPKQSTSDLKTTTDYVEGFLNSLDTRLSHISPDSEYSDDNAELVQYGRNMNVVDHDLLTFGSNKNVAPVFIDEKRLKENKEKLLERYVRANQNLMNLEGNGDPDFGTPV